MNDEEKGLLSADERADLLNDLNKLLEEKGYNLIVGGYDDTSKVFFSVFFLERI